MATFGQRLMHAWNAFTGAEQQRRGPYSGYYGAGAATGRRPDRPIVYMSNERSIISSIYNRLGIDVASVKIRHAKVDDQERYTEEVNSQLNNCFKVEANIDQAARMFRQDIAMTLFEEGVCAVVPIDTTVNPDTGSFDIQTLRIGRIVEWFPYHVRVNVFNEKTGKREDLTCSKKTTAIIENPLYSVMNEPNSTLQRLVRKLNLLDQVDELTSSGKLDLIIQLPYVIKSEARRQQAEQRRADIEFQLKGSQYGIAYTDGSEKITQLNRPAENNLLTQVQSLTELLYVQLGLTPEVMNGTADEKTTLNYWDRTIEPVLEAITEAMARTFLTKTARTQGHRILYFRDYFKIVPISGEGGMADIADKFTRNEILTSNEVRQIIGYKPSDEPKADQLVNSNMPQGDTGVPPAAGEPDVPDISNMSTEDIFNNLEVPDAAA